MKFSDIRRILNERHIQQGVLLSSESGCFIYVLKEETIWLQRKPPEQGQL